MDVRAVSKIGWLRELSISDLGFRVLVVGFWCRALGFRALGS